MWNYRTLENRMKPVIFLLWIVRLFAPKYYGIHESNKGDPIHVIEFRKSMSKRIFSDDMYEDFRITYLTKDGRMFTVSESCFYKFYGRKP